MLEWLVMLIKCWRCLAESSPFYTSLLRRIVDEQLVFVRQPKYSRCLDVQAKSSLSDTLPVVRLSLDSCITNKALSASGTSTLVLILIRGSIGLPGVKSTLVFSSFVVDCFTDDFPRIQSPGPAAGSQYSAVGFGSYSAPARPPRRSSRNRCRES